MTKKKAKPKIKAEGSVDLSQLLPGSPTWIEAVYSSGPARSVEGRSRPTQRDMSVRTLNKTSDAAEGRLEAQRARTVSRLLRREADGDGRQIAFAEGYKEGANYFRSSAGVVRGCIAAALPVRHQIGA